MSKTVVSHSWLDKRQSVLLITVQDQLSWQDYRQEVQRARRIIAQQQHRVDTIVLIDTHKNVLPQGEANRHFGETFNNRPQNAGVVVIVNAPMLLKATVQLFLMAGKHYANQPVHFADTVEEAQRTILYLRKSALRQAAPQVAKSAAPRV